MLMEETRRQQEANIEVVQIDGWMDALLRHDSSKAQAHEPHLQRSFEEAPFASKEG